jgi:hypothetical protein
MKRFHFPLDRVLRFRELEAEAEEARLEALLARVRDFDARLAALDQEGADTAAAVRLSMQPSASNACGPVFHPDELATYPDYRFLLARGRTLLEAERRYARDAVERQRLKVIAAHRAREVLERAKTQARARWDAAYAKEQEETASELYLARWRRRPAP